MEAMEGIFKIGPGSKAGADLKKLSPIPEQSYPFTSIRIPSNAGITFFGVSRATVA
jgi:hypothetical protein